MTTWLFVALVGFLQTLAVSAVLVPLVRNLAPRLGLIDAPTLARKIHTTPIPRAGGIAIFIAFWGCLAADLWLAHAFLPGMEGLPRQVRDLAANIPTRLRQLGGIATGATIIFVLGLLDDRFNLPARRRLVVQMLAVVPPLLVGVGLKLFLPVAVAAVITILWVALLTNSLNFLDNMNGLTSGVSVIICAVMALVSLLSREYYMLLLFALLAGAVLGFWLYNFPKASVFLGDAGSTHLGYLFGTLTCVATYYEASSPSPLPVLMPVIVLGVPLFDTLSVMWIRWRTGRPLMEGDTNHFSHRLVALGMSRVEAVLFIYGVTLCVGLAAIALRPLDWRHGLVQTAMVALVFLAIHRIERVSRSRRGEPGNPTPPPPPGEPS